MTKYINTQRIMRREKYRFPHVFNFEIMKIIKEKNAQHQNIEWNKSLNAFKY